MSDLNLLYFCFREFRCSVMKTTQALVSLYANVSVCGKLCGVKHGNVTKSGPSFVIDSTHYNKRRKWRNVILQHDAERDNVEESLADNICAISKYNITSDVSNRNDSHTDFQKVLTFKDRVLVTSFSSYQNILYQNDVFASNSETLQKYCKASNSKTEFIAKKAVKGTTGNIDGSSSIVKTNVCFPLLVDIFPSMSLLCNIVQMKSLHNSIACVQQMSVNVLRERFHLSSHFSFFRLVFLLGDVSGVFADLRIKLFNCDNNSGFRRVQAAQQSYQTRAISDSIMSKVVSHLPPNISESLVSVAFARKEKDVKCGNDHMGITSGKTFSEAEKLYSILDDLVIELHYPSPLSEIFSPSAISVYNEHLKYLLKVTLCCWTSEMLWKQSTGSNSFLTQICTGRTLRSEWNEKMLSLQHLHRSCMTGLQWIIHASRALESFYLHEIHNVQYPNLNATLEEIYLHESCRSSISHLSNIHDDYLNQVTSCVEFLNYEVMATLESSITALGVFNETHNTAEANKTLLVATGDMNDNSSNFEMVMKVLNSRLSHASNKMNYAQESIILLIDKVEKLYHRHEVHQQELGRDEVRYISALRSLLGHISRSKAID